jgi:hypothetical protein
MQIKVTNDPNVAQPLPDPTPIDPVTLPPVVVPPVNADPVTKLLSSYSAPSLAVNLKPAIGNVLQCGIFIPELNQWFSSQATNGTNGTRSPYENTVISRMSASGALLDSMTLNNGGHGTSIGVEVVNGTTYIYGTYQANAGYTAATNDLVRFVYTPGTFDRSAVPGLTVMPKLDPGYDTIAFDWYNDWMVVRNSGGTKDNYIRRKISEWKAGTDVKYGMISLQQAPPTLQGFCTMNDCLFRYIGASNGEKLSPPDPTYVEQYSWANSQRIDRVNYTTLGRSATGTYPDGTHEPEACTMYRESDGTATLTFSVTLGLYPNHQWKMYKLSKIGAVVYAFAGDASDANENDTQDTSGDNGDNDGGTTGTVDVNAFTLGTTKPVANNSGAGILRAYPTGTSGTKSGTQTIGGSTVLSGWVINGDVNISGNAQLLDCVVHGRVLATGSSGNPLVENCVVDGNGDYGASAGNAGGDVWLLQSTMTGGYVNFRFNTVKSRTVTYKINGIGYKNFHSYRNDVSQVVDGSSVTATGASGVLMQGDYIHGLMFVKPDPNHSDWTHNDCCQVHGGTGTTWEGVNFEATVGALHKGNSPYGSLVTGQAIGVTSDVSTASSGLTVKNSWLSGGAHGFIAIVGNNTATNIGTLTNVRFGHDSKSNACQVSSHLSYTATKLTYADTGTSVKVIRAES